MEEVPPQVLERIAATVREVVDTPELARFGIGRSENPTAACRTIGADAVIEVFRTGSPEEAGNVELDLARRFATDPKWRDVGDPMGSEGTRVFVALWAIDEIGTP